MGDRYGRMPLGHGGRPLQEQRAYEMVLVGPASNVAVTFQSLERRPWLQYNVGSDGATHCAMAMAA